MPTDEQLLGFLAKLAILPEFTAPQAAALFSEEKASVILENCHQRGFFIQKITAPDPIYRFHSLFREALQQIQPQFLTAEEIKNYHLKAAVYYIEHRIFDRAIEHFITCGNVDLAVELITRESVNLLAFEALEQFRLWFKLLPEEVVSNNGYLLYIKSFITLHKRPGDALPLLERSLEIFRQADDPIMQVYILISMSQSYLERNNIKGLRWIQEQASMLSEGKQGQPVEWMLAVLDFTLAVWEEKFSKAISRLHFLKSIELVDEWQYLLLFYSSQTYCFMGELNLAESHIREALDLNIVKQAELLRGYILLAVPWSC